MLSVLLQIVGITAIVDRIRLELIPKFIIPLQLVSMRQLQFAF